MPRSWAVGSSADPLRGTEWTECLCWASYFRWRRHWSLHHPAPLRVLSTATPATPLSRAASPIAYIDAPEAASVPRCANMKNACCDTVGNHPWQQEPSGMPVWYWGVWERAHEKACCFSIPRRRATTSDFEVKSKAMGREQPVATGLDLVLPRTAEAMAARSKRSRATGLELLCPRACDTNFLVAALMGGQQIAKPLWSLTAQR